MVIILHTCLISLINTNLVLLDKLGSIRLCDFGFGKMFDATKLLDTYCGSPFYAAPEMVTATPYRGPPVDMWSCGVILYAMLTGQLPFHCDTMPELFKKISLAQYAEPNTLSDEALSLIKCLLCRNPKRRITAEGVLKHAWLTDNPKRMYKKKLHTLNSIHHSFTINNNNPTYYTMSPSPTNTLPSPIISVGDEELASYSNTPDNGNQRASKATRFLLHALNKKSQVAPSREKSRDTTGKRGNKPFLVTAERIKRFFSSTFVQRRLTTT